MLPDRIPHHSLAGRLLRLPLRLVPGDIPRRILGGPGKGLLWYPASGPHAIWLGLYERAVQRRFQHHATARGPLVVWDVGAHTGLYALLAARAGARVVAFEPLEGNRGWMDRNLRVNGLQASVQVVPFALSSRSGTGRWAPEASGMQGRLSPEGALEVAVCTADELDVPPPDVLKLDVEGAELDVLRGAERLLAERRPVVFVETHDPVTIGDCLAYLPEYHADEVEPRRYACAPAGRSST